jgi:hypothetical protein
MGANKKPLALTNPTEFVPFYIGAVLKVFPQGTTVVDEEFNAQDAPLVKSVRVMEQFVVKRQLEAVSKKEE